jgi:DNA-binding NtrC family response regulator
VGYCLAMKSDGSRMFDEGPTTLEVEDILKTRALFRKATLEVVTGPDSGMRVPVTSRLFRVGSDPLCDMVLTDPTTSRRHCEIHVSTEGFLLQDLGSTNGTFVDELRLGEVFLDDGVLIRVGNSLLRFHAERPRLELPTLSTSVRSKLIGSSPSIQAIFEQIKKVAPTDLSVVIEGETGTGKELVASAIHAHSRRMGKPFVVFDCSAFPPTLIESELFGHDKGAFSGAIGVHKGVFERANGGTIFFDELGEMDVEFQAKFLRALESGEVRRVGGEKTFHVDVRVVAATNRSLEQMISERRFRQDLFYRLAKVRLNLPPLRERPDDIAALVDYFLVDSQRDGLRPVPLVTPEAMDVLRAYLWPGNIRELRNIVERAAALCEGGRITGDYLRQELGMVGPGAGPLPEPALAAGAEAPHEALLPDGDPDDDSTIPLRDAKELVVGEFEKRYLVRLLEKHNQNISRAARDAQIDRRHFYRLLKKYELMSGNPDDDDK